MKNRTLKWGAFKWGAFKWDDL